MAAHPINPAIADKIIAEWRIGEYSQQDLAERNKVSKGLVNKLCKNVAQDMRGIVTSGIQYGQALAAQDDRIVTAVTEAVDKKVQRLEWLRTAAMKNVQDSMKAPCLDQQDFKARGQTINEAVKTVDPDKNPSTAIQIINNQQALSRSLTDDELIAIASGAGAAAAAAHSQ
jgi:hypothetical protein